MKVSAFLGPVVALLLACSSVACATIGTRLERNDLDSTLYAGTRADVGLFALVLDPPNSEAAYAVLLLPFALMDLPLSLAADTLLMPWTIPEHFSSRRRKLQTLVAEIEQGDLAGVQAVAEGEPELLRLDMGDGETPLLRAARQQHDDVTAWLAGEAFRAEDTRNLARALTVAIESGRADLAATLLDSGASANGTSRSAPLLVAAEQGDLPIAELLLARGASPDGAVEGKQSPLHAAAMRGQAEMAELLLARGARVDARNHRGATPLHEAARYGHSSVALVFLDHGADLTARTGEGRTPLAEALAFRRADVTEFLRQRGAVE